MPTASAASAAESSSAPPEGLQHRVRRGRAQTLRQHHRSGADHRREHGVDVVLRRRFPDSQRGVRGPERLEPGPQVVVLERLDQVVRRSRRPRRPAPSRPRAPRSPSRRRWHHPRHAWRGARRCRSGRAGARRAAPGRGAAARSPRARPRRWRPRRRRRSRAARSTNRVWMRGHHEVVVDDEHGQVAGHARSSVTGQPGGEDGAAVVVHRDLAAPTLADHLHQREPDTRGRWRRWAWWSSRAGRARRSPRARRRRCRRPGRARRRRPHAAGPRPRRRRPRRSRRPRCRRGCRARCRRRRPRPGPAAAAPRRLPAAGRSRRSAARLTLAISSAATDGSSMREVTSSVISARRRVTPPIHWDSSSYSSSWIRPEIVCSWLLNSWVCARSVSVTLSRALSSLCIASSSVRSRSVVTVPTGRPSCSTRLRLSTTTRPATTRTASCTSSEDSSSLLHPGLQTEVGQPTPGAVGGQPEQVAGAVADHGDLPVGGHRHHALADRMQQPPRAGRPAR